MEAQFEPDSPWTRHCSPLDQKAACVLYTVEPTLCFSRAAAQKLFLRGAQGAGQEGPVEKDTRDLGKLAGGGAEFPSQTSTMTSPLSSV